jgi:hypothetical protein
VIVKAMTNVDQQRFDQRQPPSSPPQTFLLHHRIFAHSDQEVLALRTLR